MKIKAYFVTYDNDFELNQTLKTFAKSGIKDFNYEIFIVNNFKDAPVVLDDVGLKYTVITNSTRPTFSTGHLARNWNECLIDGFKDLENPDCDIVILSQNDVHYDEGTINKLVESHKIYNFITSGCGDAFHSYTIDAIMAVGLWDERYCNIGWQECDYFLRHLIYNKKGSSINDLLHSRINNRLDYDLVNVEEKYSGFVRNDIHHMKSMKYHNISMNTFIKKWGLGVPGIDWQGPMSEYKDGIYPSAYDITPDVVLESPQWIMYPFFESKIPNLSKKNYVNYEAQN